MTTNAPRNYLNNKDILLEIHRSKSSYCSFLDPTFHQYDIILAGLDKINVRTIAQAKRNQAKRLGDIDYNTKKLAGEKIKQSEKFDQMQNLFLKVHLMLLDIEMSFLLKRVPEKSRMEVNLFSLKFSLLHL